MAKDDGAIETNDNKGFWFIQYDEVRHAAKAQSIGRTGAHRVWVDIPGGASLPTVTTGRLHTTESSAWRELLATRWDDIYRLGKEYQTLVARAVEVEEREARGA